MSNHDDEVYRSAANRRKALRRNQIVAGVVGLGAVLGAGAYVVTAQIIDHHNGAVTTETGALAPMAIPAEEPSSPAPTTVSAFPSSAPPAITTKSAVKRPESLAPSASMPLTPEEEIRQAREAAERDGVRLQHPLTAAGAEPAKVTERSEQMPNGTLRIIKARFDLTGHRELLWAADGGTTVGNAKCTQNVHFSQDAEPTIQPNLLLCWRTSAEKSVATILVDRRGHPSTATSVKVIDREWSKLG